MREGDEPVKKTSRKSLRLLGSVGEPINPGGLALVPPRGRRGPLPDRRHLVADRDRRHPDHARCPAPTDLKPGSATTPFFGVQPALVDTDGKVLEGATKGNLCHHGQPGPA